MLAEVGRLAVRLLLQQAIEAGVEASSRSWKVGTRRGLGPSSDDHDDEHFDSPRPPPSGSSGLTPGLAERELDFPQGATSCLGGGNLTASFWLAVLHRRALALPSP